MVVTTQEWLWRRWILGEGEFKKFGPRNKGVRPDVGYGAPGEDPVPQRWWMNLEQFLIQRRRNGEPDVPTSVTDRLKSKIPRAAAPPGQLSPHFYVHEFNCKNGEKVPQVAIPALRRLCVDFLEPMRERFGVCHILSGFRPPAYNAYVGGAKYSQHIYTLTPASVAADSFYAKGNPKSWATYARTLANRKKLGGVGRYDDAGFVHIDNGPRRDWP